MDKNVTEIKTEENNKNESVVDNNDKPFVNMDNIDNMPILNKDIKDV